MKIDIAFDFQAEAGLHDPDRYSPTLQEYHRILWSKPLPNGKLFELKKISGNRLFHSSELGEFFLSSDRAVATFYKWKISKHFISQIPQDKVDAFVKLADTIGGIVIWPSNQVNRQRTINAARGFKRVIADRLDITLECIQRYYLGKHSPLYETFYRCGDFFGLFGNFKGYIDFFLLQDHVTDDYRSVKIAPPFYDFKYPPIPKNAEEYMRYIDYTETLVAARNVRISELEF